MGICQWNRQLRSSLYTRKTKEYRNSVTLPNDINNIEQLEEVLLALTEQVTYRLRKEKLLANSVSVQLRTKKFEDTSHQENLILQHQVQRKY